MNRRFNREAGTASQAGMEVHIVEHGDCVFIGTMLNTKPLSLLTSKMRFNAAETI
jgi:hypothetical protein